MYSTSMYMCVENNCFFFFKQKTAYEMRISDWSSDVCSSDLITPEGWTKSLTAVVCTVRYEAIAPVEKKRKFTNMLRRNDDMKIWLAPFDKGQIGRESCRDRVCQYV